MMKRHIQRVCRHHCFCKRAMGSPALSHERFIFGFGSTRNDCTQANVSNAIGVSALEKKGMSLSGNPIQISEGSHRIPRLRCESSGHP